MTDLVLVNRDRTALLPPNSPQKGYRIAREEAAALGLVDSPVKPTQQRRSPAFDATQAVVPTTPKPQRRRKPKR